MNVQTSPFVDVIRVEPTRYALIRRLGYVFRHHLVVNLQPLSMICQVMHHRLNAEPVDVSAMHNSVDQVSRLVRSSIDSCQDVVSWLTADVQSMVAASVAVGECIANLRSSFSFRGFSIRYEEPSLDTVVSQIAVREVLTAALIAATDQANGLDEIVVTLLPTPGALEIAIQLRKGAKESSAEQDAYRLLDWNDVQMLAVAHGQQFSNVSDGFVKIRISDPADTRQ